MSDLSELHTQMLERIAGGPYFDVVDLSPEERKAADELVALGLIKPLYNEQRWGGDGALVGWVLAKDWYGPSWASP